MLTLENVSFDVRDEKGEKDIIKNLSLTIDDNKFVVITGPNGGGKSTLAKLIAGIYTPSAGKIYFNGQDITEASITERANMGISFAFQQPVRFKGVQVLDLIRLAAKESCLRQMPVSICQRWDYVRKIILTGRLMQAFPAASLSALRLQR